MSKILMFVVVLIGTLLVLNIAGFNPPSSGFVYKLVSNGTQTDDGKLIDYDSDNNRISDTKSYDLWVKLVLILALLGGAGIIIGTFFNVVPTDYVIAPFIIFVGGTLMIDLIWLLNEFWGFGMPYNMIGMLFITALIGGLIVSLVEWWRFGT